MRLKRTMSWVLALVMALSLFPAAALAAEGDQTSTDTRVLTQAMFTVNTAQEFYTGSPITKTIPAGTETGPW